MPVIMLSVEIHFCLANIPLKISGQPRKNYFEKVSEAQKSRSFSMFPYQETISLPLPVRNRYNYCNWPVQSNVIDEK